MCSFGLLFRFIAMLRVISLFTFNLTNDSLSFLIARALKKSFFFIFVSSLMMNSQLHSQLDLAVVALFQRTVYMNDGFQKEFMSSLK